MFSSLFFVFSALLLVLSHTVNAAPVSPVEFLAVAPTITSPSGPLTIWTSGSTQSVSWKIDNIPAEAQNYTVTVLLGYLTSGSENLDIKNPLATQVPIMAGTVQIKVPANLTTRTNYVVAVIGDSGDVSQPFTIL